MKWILALLCVVVGCASQRSAPAPIQLSRQQQEPIVYPSAKDSTRSLISHLQGSAGENDFVGAQMRAMAIDLLGERRAEESIPFLIECLDDGRALSGSDNWVGGHAASALSRITGRPFSVDKQHWVEWWEEQQKER